MSVHYEEHPDKYVVRWREDGRNRSHRFAIAAACTAAALPVAVAGATPPTVEVIPFDETEVVAPARPWDSGPTRARSRSRFITRAPSCTGRSSTATGRRSAS